MSVLSSVLLVDDDATSNYLNKLLISRLSVTEQVFMAENGEQALHLLASACQAPDYAGWPRLILLDLNMPVMNGADFLAHYIQLPWAQREGTVIIILTTSVHERDQANASHLLVDDFLSKPLTEQKVTALLQRHFAGEV